MPDSLHAGHRTARHQPRHPASPARPQRTTDTAPARDRSGSGPRAIRRGPVISRPWSGTRPPSSRRQQATGPVISRPRPSPARRSPRLRPAISTPRHCITPGSLPPRAAAPVMSMPTVTSDSGTSVSAHDGGGAQRRKQARPSRPRPGARAASPPRPEKDGKKFPFASGRADRKTYLESERKKAAPPGGH